ncbi:MAG TPA: MOSC N-terminal beta barrel domain-containing protein [Steroidobacteraceae bacterium]|nr:MOSC N-terminal beta barrel domain-containing protein [Steroidobacteraceae bacterium]
MTDEREPAEATVVELYVYPLKSGRAIRRSAVDVAATGFAWDRQWMAVDATETFVSQRTHPRLALIEPALDPTHLTLRSAAAGSIRVPLDLEGPSRPVRVWNDVCAGLDQGDEASEWLSEIIGDAVRLVRVDPAMGRVANPRFAGPDSNPVTFVDGFPILVCNRASLAELNTRMPSAIPMSRFRPNLVLEGLPAFAEDWIDTLDIGKVALRLVKPCTRCVITSTDQQTGERTTNPLPVLRRYRFSRELMGVMFGENAIITSGVGLRIVEGASCIARAPH